MKTATATVRTLRNDYATLLRRVEAGEEISISRRGQVVAKLVPADAAPPPTDWSISAAGQLPRGGKALSAKQSAAILAESGGRG